MDWDAAKQQMIEKQLQARGIVDPRVLAAMREAPRHLFVPEALQSESYEDCALPVGYEGTISQPYMVALMLQTLKLEGEEKVLEIGTGTGYEAALLGMLAREVHTIEIVPELAAIAERLLASISLARVTVHCGDGSTGLPDQAPFQAVVAAAAAPNVPSPWIEQLADPARLLLPLKKGPKDILVLIERKAGQLTRSELSPCAFVPLRGQYGTPG